MPSNNLTEQVIGCAIEVHKALGPGLLESSYEACLMYELLKLDIPASNQVTLPIAYKGNLINNGYRVDILVSEQLIIELKVTESILPIHVAQTLTYMKLSGIKTGLIINFNMPTLIKGIKRLSL